ncbi:hypothetical protein AOLI_G00221040 [Acnodon oligacanthus]
MISLNQVAFAKPAGDEHWPTNVGDQQFTCTGKRHSKYGIGSYWDTRCGLKSHVNVVRWLKFDIDKGCSWVWARTTLRYGSGKERHWILQIDAKSYKTKFTHGCKQE